MIDKVDILICNYYPFVRLRGIQKSNSLQKEFIKERYLHCNLNSTKQRMRLAGTI